MQYNTLLLAAGIGKRLRPLTDNIPKCMVEYKVKPIISYILEANSDINDIACVTGFKQKILEEFLRNKAKKEIRFFHNPDFESSNMLFSLFHAEEFLHHCIEEERGLIISYTDIIYPAYFIKQLMDEEADASVIINKEWRKFFIKRKSPLLDDAESLKVKDGKIIELGKKLKNEADLVAVEGQYIGLFALKPMAIKAFIKLYYELQNKGEDTRNMFMTDFLNIFLKNFPLSPSFVYGNWLEIDNKEDLEIEND